MAGALLGALLLVVADFTVLYHVHTEASPVAIRSVQTGSNHDYVMVLIGVVAALIAATVRAGSGRAAIVAIGVLGVVGLLIALLGDLPDARHTGLIGSAARGYTNASASPSAGLYMETLGAVILIATCGSGLLLAGRPAE